MMGSAVASYVDTPGQDGTEASMSSYRARGFPDDKRYYGDNGGFAEARVSPRSSNEVLTSQGVHEMALTRAEVSTAPASGIMLL